MQHKLIGEYNYRVCHPERSAAQSKDLRLFLSRQTGNPYIRVCPNPRAYLKIFFSAIPPLCLISFLKAFVNFV